MKYSMTSFMKRKTCGFLWLGAGGHKDFKRIKQSYQYILLFYYITLAINAHNHSL